MPTNIPEAAATRKGEILSAALLTVALVFYAMVAVAMIHATMVVTPDVFLATAP